jgi:hypothetical protein
MKNVPSLLKQKISATLIILFFVLFQSYSVFSQTIGIGADAMYNFQTESFGAGARVCFFPNRRLSITPQFSYYFAFNKVNEYYAGAALEYKFIRTNRFNIYAIAHGAYDSWLNYEVSPMKTAHLNNWNAEGGLGISTNTCLRPFLEYRYNIRFLETHLRFGVLYIFGCRSSSGMGGSRDKHCDAYRN